MKCQDFKSSGSKYANAIYINVETRNRCYFQRNLGFDKIMTYADFTVRSNCFSLVSFLSSFLRSSRKKFRGSIKC